MTATVTYLSTRRRTALPAASTTARVLPTPTVEGAGGEPFTRYTSRGGRPEWLTPWGRAYRIGGRWFIGTPARQVTVPATIAALDAAELRHP